MSKIDVKWKPVRDEMDKITGYDLVPLKLDCGLVTATIRRDTWVRGPVWKLEVYVNFEKEHAYLPWQFEKRRRLEVVKGAFLQWLRGYRKNHQTKPLRRHTRGREGGGT